MAKEAKVGDITMRRAMVVDKYSDLVTEVREGRRALTDVYREALQRKKTSAADQSRPKPSKHMITLITHTGKKVPYQLPKGKSKFNETNECVGWARHTWNPITGCLHDCDWGCYARELAHRDHYAPYYPVGFTPLFHHERLDAPANTPVPEEAATDTSWRRVFVVSMGDLFGSWISDDIVRQVLQVCHDNPQWEYLFLTKNPRRYLSLPIPLPPTAWAGTSIDRQNRVKLAEEVFKKIKSRVNWASCEPMMEHLRFHDLTPFDWIVSGALTATNQPEGPKPAFAPDLEWVADLRKQAHAAGAKVFEKVNLLGDTHSQKPGMKLCQEVPNPPLLTALKAAE